MYVLCIIRGAIINSCMYVTGTAQTHYVLVILNMLEKWKNGTADARSLTKNGQYFFCIVVTFIVKVHCVGENW